MILFNLPIQSLSILLWFGMNTTYLAFDYNMLYSGPFVFWLGIVNASQDMQNGSVQKVRVRV